MITEGHLDTKLWLSRQSSILPDIFERAATELEANGVRLRTGSFSPKIEECDCVKRIAISPLRFSRREEFLSLSLAASTRGGPPRYVVLLEVSGTPTIQALYNLVSAYSDVWSKGYVMSGLWLGDGTDWELLNRLDQLVPQACNPKIAIASTFLHSAMPRTIQDGLMLVAVLYRSVLDELSSAAKMGRLYSQFTNSLHGRKPSFQRLIRP